MVNVRFSDREATVLFRELEEGDFFVRYPIIDGPGNEIFQKVKHGRSINAVSFSGTPLGKNYLLIRSLPSELPVIPVKIKSVEIEVERL